MSLLLNNKIRLITFYLALLTLVMAGCATTTPPDLSQLITESRLETLSSSINLSFRNSKRSLSGRGYMVFRQPDQMRLIVLSPFGTTMVEAGMTGDQLALAYPTNGEIYLGPLQDLPKGTGQQGFTMLQWVLDMKPPYNAPLNGVLERPGRNGTREEISVDNGLVTQKSLSSGEQVRYRNYTILNGVALPQELIMESAEGDRIKITLVEPEVNLELEPQAFNVSMRGLRVLPLKVLRFK